MRRIRGSRALVCAFAVPLALLAGCGGLEEGDEAFGQSSIVECPNGARLEGYKTAVGKWGEEIDYDWTLQKTVVPNSAATIGIGTYQIFDYALIATKTVGARKSAYWVEGKVCVKNTGWADTQDLAIVDIVKYQNLTGWQELTRKTLDVSGNPVLSPGESHCYPYKIYVTQPAGCLGYKNVAEITIANGDENNNTVDTTNGTNGTGLVVYAPFWFPASPCTTSYRDGVVKIEDYLSCPAGFTCTPTAVGPWSLWASGTIRYALKVANCSAACETSQYLWNKAVLTEKDSCVQHYAYTKTLLETEPCDGGCTRTPGYWKNHTTHLSELLPLQLGSTVPKGVLVSSVATALDILDRDLGGSSNGIAKLYSHLLATKLNIKDGASSAGIAGVIIAADAFLGLYDYTSWDSLTKTQQKLVEAWKDALDAYNNGVTGPGKCK